MFSHKGPKTRKKNLNKIEFRLISLGFHVYFFSQITAFLKANAFLSERRPKPCVSVSPVRLSLSIYRATTASFEKILFKEQKTRTSASETPFPVWGRAGAGAIYDPELRRAAERVQIIFDHFGNLTIKPEEEEISAINSLLSDLYEITADINYPEFTWLVSRIA
ncbi:MAG TPA: hypothetical protein VFC65_10555 [Prolixibacteraceae bacterium]|nr:hypothetical protein [Prolixibacteraceae bacterium]